MDNPSLSRRLARGAVGSMGLDPRWLESASGSAAIVWAVIVLLLPDDLVDHPGYAAVGLFLPDAVWMTLAFVGGLAQLLAARTDHREARIPLAGLMAALFGLFALGIWSGARGSPTLAPYAALAVWNVLAMLVLIERWWCDRPGRPT